MFQQLSRFFLFLVFTGGLVSSARADEPVLFKYKLEKGQQLIVRHKSENKTAQTVMGNNVDSEISQTAVDVRSVDELAADGAAKFKSKTERINIKIKIGPLGDFAFDSKKPDRDNSSVLGKGLTPLYERIVGSELQGEVTNRGVVTSLTGYGQLVGDLLKDNPIAAQFAGGGSDNAAKLAAQGNWVVFPEKAVKPGEKWENPFEMEMPKLGAIKGKQTVTFLSLETRDGHSIAKMSISSDIAFDLNLDMGAAKVTGKISTSNSEGSAEFDVTAGKLLNQNSKITLTGELSVAVNNMTIPVQVTQTIGSETTTLDKLPE